MRIINVIHMNINTLICKIVYIIYNTKVKIEANG